MDSVSCPICLESFDVNEAYIPDLDCNCTLIVHWSCWEPWTGECLYCRNTIEYEEPHIEVIIIRRDVYVCNMCFIYYIFIYLIIFISILLGRYNARREA